MKTPSQIILLLIVSFTLVNAQEELVLLDEYELQAFPIVEYHEDVFSNINLETWVETISITRPRDKSLWVVDKKSFRINWEFNEMGDFLEVESLLKIPGTRVFFILTWFADPNKVEFYENKPVEYRWAPQGDFRTSLDFSGFFEGPITFGFVIEI